jgi:UDP-N-acetylmuramoyl-tripeptide--D-alanyl-D-alanine ligase
MKPLSISEITQAVGGKLKPGMLAHDEVVAAVCTNTKEMKQSSLFVAIKGERFDAHDFLAAAAAGGAVAAIVEREPVPPIAGLQFIQVPDTRIALCRLGSYVRSSFGGIVVAVAGSNGKTSTKHLIDAALRGALKGSISPKSFNNDIGVPLTIFDAEPGDDYLVLEVGTNHPGELQPLSEMARPDIAIITNIGAEHLEGFGDLAGVRKEEASVIAGLNPRGTLIVNGDDAELVAAVKSFPGTIITFGFETTNDLFAADVRCEEEGTSFSLNGGREVFVPMLGRHAASNALAAIAVGQTLRVAEDTIIESLAKSDEAEMRLELQKANGLTILNDAYNANPNSMRAALDTAAALPHAGRRIAVLGDMLELGQSSERYHREIGAAAAQCGFELLACVGPDSRWLADGAEAAGMPRQSVFRFDDSKAAAENASALVRKGDLVLIKASRGIQLENVAKALTA